MVPANLVTIRLKPISPHYFTAYAMPRRRNLASNGAGSTAENCEIYVTAAHYAEIDQCRPSRKWSWVGMGRNA